MSVSLSRILPAAVATVVLVASAAVPAGAPAVARRQGCTGAGRCSAGREDRPRPLLRRRRHAAGPCPALRRPRRDAGDATAAQEGRLGDQGRTAHPGAAEHRCRVVQPGDRGVARGDRLDEQHLPYQRSAVREPHGRLRPRRAAGRVHRAVRGAWRQEGRADRVGRRTRRGHPGPDGGLPVVLLRPRRGHELPLSHRRRGVHPVVRAAVRLAGGLRRQRALPAGRARPRPPAGRTSRRATARRRRCACACSTPARTSTA